MSMEQMKTPAEAERNEASPFDQSEGIINQLTLEMSEMNFESLDEMEVVTLSKKLLDEVAQHLENAEKEQSTDYVRELAGLLLEDLSIRQFAGDFEKNNILKKPLLEFLESCASPELEKAA